MADADEHDTAVSTVAEFRFNPRSAALPETRARPSFVKGKSNQ